MSSKVLGAPPLKLILAAIVIVVGLHVLAAVALVVSQHADKKVEPKKDTPPIEIEFVSLPPTPQATAQQLSQPTPAPKPKTEPTSKPVSKPKPVVPDTPKEPQPQKPMSTQPKTPSKVSDVTNVTKVTKVKKAAEKPQEIVTQAKGTPKTTPPKQTPDETIAPPSSINAAAAEERQAQEQEAQRQALAAAEAQKASDAHDRAVQEATRAAAKAAKEAALAQAAADKAAREAAVSNEPVNFTASTANWATAPAFSFPARAARRASSGDVFTVVLILRVNKQGGIDSVRISQSSGNRRLDQEAQKQVRSGTFKPFTKNGVPVVGNVTLPISYEVP